MKIFSRAAALFIAVLMGISLVGCNHKSDNSTSTANLNEKGKLVVKVVDKTTKKPVKDASIAIMGAVDTYKTNEKGETPEIKLDVNRDFYKRYGENLQKKAPSGTVTVLVSKDGYKEYIAINKAVYAGYTANNMTVELSKLSSKDKQKFVSASDLPHASWVADLVDYCKNLKDSNEGSAVNNVTVSIKNTNSKAMEGVTVVVPELGVKGVTDKGGMCVLKLDSYTAGQDIYPVKRNVSDYTIVAMKDGYEPYVLFNASVEEGKDTLFSVKMKQGKDSISINGRPYENEWIEKLIASFKE